MKQRTWAMASHRTFTIVPVKEIIGKHVSKSETWLDPFANANTIKRIGYDNVITNDLNPVYRCDHCLDAVEFLSKFKGIDGVLFDAPYSVRQISECYKKVGESITGETTSSLTYSRWKDACARAVKPGGMAISFAWNSTGLGANRNFDIIEILLVCHGGNHNDTIVTVERKRTTHALPASKLERCSDIKERTVNDLI